MKCIWEGLCVFVCGVCVCVLLFAIVSRRVASRSGTRTTARLVVMLMTLVISVTMKMIHHSSMFSAEEALRVAAQERARLQREVNIYTYIVVDVL